MGRNVRCASAAGLVLLTLTACSAASPNPAPTSAPHRVATATPTHAPSTPWVTRHPTRTPSRARTSAPSRQPSPAPPRSGRRILPDKRVVAYYGAPGSDALGVLGRGTPDEAAAAIERQATQYQGFGRPVQPAMELIATVAQGGPGADGLYSKPIPFDDVARYLAAAHRHRMLLILDFQPGRGEFLPQVERFEPFLLDPSVSIALDPEWKVGPDQVPAQVIGSARASSINAVGRYLSNLVVSHHLPDKLLVVHQFTPPMLPDRDAIAQQHGLELVLHADGLATPAAKIAVYHKLAFPCPPFHAGFKLFFRADTGLMSPAQVMALRPQPEIVTYQ